MLNGKLELWDVRDTEALCGRVIQMSGLELDHHEREELLAYLVALAWELSLEYEPGIIRRGFSLWVTTTLRRRVTDWHRQRNGRTKWQFANGRTHERQLPKFQSIDDRPELLDTYGPLEAGPDRLSSAGRLFGTGDSEDPRGDNGMGEDAVRTAA